MKQFLSILIFGLLLVLSTAQSQAQSSQVAAATSLSSTDLVLTADTAVNTGTATMASGLIASFYDKFGMQVTCTRLSGTGQGTVILQQSMDGTTFETVPTTDTLTLANNANAQTIIFEVAQPTARYFRAHLSGGNASGTVKITAVWRAVRKPQS